MGEINPCQKPTRKPATSPFPAGVSSAVFGPGVQGANRTTFSKATSGRLDLRLSNRVHLLYDVSYPGRSSMSKFKGVVDGIDMSEFAGCGRVINLWKGGYDAIPSVEGVYVVMRDVKSAPVFLVSCPVPFHNGRSLAYSLSQLQARWLQVASIIYVGKSENLRSRIRAYCQFGEGKPRAHSGGRSIWQLADAKDLVIGWKTTTLCDPALEETRLLEQFKMTNGGRRPFANVRD